MFTPHTTLHPRRAYSELRAKSQEDDKLSSDHHKSVRMRHNVIA